MPSVNVFFGEPSRGVRSAINRDRTFAGYVGLRAASTKAAELFHVEALVYVYDALGDDIQYLES